MKRAATHTLEGTPPEKKKRAVNGPIAAESATAAQLAELPARLSVDQRLVYDRMMDGQSLFFAGEAGCGKVRPPPP